MVMLICSPLLLGTYSVGITALSEKVLRSRPTKEAAEAKRNQFQAMDPVFEGYPSDSDASDDVDGLSKWKKPKREVKTYATEEDLWDNIDDDEHPSSHYAIEMPDRSPPKPPMDMPIPKPSATTICNNDDDDGAAAVNAAATTTSNNNDDGDNAAADYAAEAAVGATAVDVIK